MDFKKLIIECVGLQDVDIENYEMDKENLKLILTVRQKKESCRCHHCNSPLQYVREWKERRIRGPSMGGFLFVEIILLQLRATCSMCLDQVRSAKVPFVHPFFQNMTLSLCELAGRWMEELPCAAVARFFQLNSKTMWGTSTMYLRSTNPTVLMPIPMIQN